MENDVALTPEEIEAITSTFNNSIFSFSTILAILIFGLWYLLQALGLYKLAKVNNISRPWRAFIPIVQISILGDLIDGPIWGFYHMGLVLSLGQLIILIVYLLNLHIWILLILMLIYYVYLECVMNQFYKEYDPYKGILFFIMGLIFPFTIPIWLFVMRKKIKGKAEYPGEN